MRTQLPPNGSAYDECDGSRGQELDVKVGDVVEVDRRGYDVVSDKAAGVALEPAITRTVEELRAAHGGRSLSPEEFDELFGGLPRDREG